MAEVHGGWLDRLADAERDAIAAAGRRRSLRPGEVLVGEGAVSGDVFVVLDGRVRISTGGSGGRATVLATVGPGEIIGELSAIDGLPHSATAAAVDDVEALVLTAEAFTQVVVAHGAVALAVLQTLAGRLRDGDRARVEFGSGTDVGRVAALILALLPRGEPVCHDVALSEKEIAARLGAPREAVNRSLRRLVALGTLEVGRDTVSILDAPQLRSIARG